MPGEAHVTMPQPADKQSVPPIQHLTHQKSAVSRRDQARCLAQAFAAPMCDHPLERAHRHRVELRDQKRATRSLSLPCPGLPRIVSPPTSPGIVKTVRHDSDIMNGCDRIDFAQLADASRFGEARLDKVCCSRLHQALEIRKRVDALAGGNRDAGCSPQLRETVTIFGWPNRLF